MSDSVGQAISTVTYFPFGATRTGSIDTEKQFTGQRHDDTGLYYYGARYYDPTIGRFISADTYVSSAIGTGKSTLLNIAAYLPAELLKFNDPDSPATLHPQLLNRYTYVNNCPLKYTDPTGHFLDWIFDAVAVAYDIYQFAKDPSWSNAGMLGLDVILAIIPFVPAGAGIAAGTIKLVDLGVSGVKTLKSFTKGHFRENLLSIYGLTKDAAKGLEAHHMLPQKFLKFFSGKGININDPKFGVLLDKTTHSKDAYAFNKDWESWIGKYGENASVEDILNYAKELAYKYGIPKELLLWLYP
jgi:RHS repeat-associated protein